MIVSLILTLLIVLCALWIALGALPAGMDGHMPLPYIIALIPFVWIPMAAVAIYGIAVREWGLVCGALAVALGSRIRQSQYRSSGGSLSASRSAGCPVEPDTRDDRPSLRLMTLNCRYGRADADAIVEAVRSRGVDALAMQEMTSDLVARLDAAGIAELLPYRQLGEERSTDNGGFNGLWTRREPLDGTTNIVHIPAADVPGVTIAVPTGNHADATDEAAIHATDAIDVTDTTDAIDVTDSQADEQATARTCVTYVTIASAHPKSPMRGCREWSAGIIGLGRLAAMATGEGSISGSDDSDDSDDSDGSNGEISGNAANAGISAHDAGRRIAVVLGDLNSGVDHPSFRRLLGQGFRDANIAAGQAPQHTYPSWLAWPRIVLDHILFTPGAEASGVEAFIVKGTDHLALTATLTIA